MAGWISGLPQVNDPFCEQVAGIVYVSMALKSPISGHRAHLRYTSCSIVGVDDQTDSESTPRKDVLVWIRIGLGSLPPKLEQKVYRK